MKKISIIVVKRICKILFYPMGKISWILHKLFPKEYPVITCAGCLNDICNHRTTEYNSYCYYIKKKNRKIWIEESDK